jgi:hypothetical protein
VEQLGGGLRRFAIIGGFVVFLALLNFSLKFYTLKQKLEKQRLLQDLDNVELSMQCF